MTNQPTAQWRGPRDPEQATFLDLFLDLAFVFAMFRLSHSLLYHLRWSDAFQTAVMLFAAWLLWNHTASITDRNDPRRPVIQVLIIGAMFGGLVLATVVPEAFDGRGTVFAGAYVIVQVGRCLFLVVVTRGAEQRHEGRQLFWFAMSTLPWLAGAFTQYWTRAGLWTVAVAVDYVAIRLGWPTPRLGRTHGPEFASSGQFLAERHRQFFIIALGEPILVTGLTLSVSGFGAYHTAAAVIGFATTVLLWRIYIHRAGQVLGEAVTPPSDPLRLAIPAVYGHPVMIAGLVTIAVGDQLVISHPDEHIRHAWIAVVLGGPALFLAGRTIFEYSVFSRVSWDHVIGILVLAAISPAMLFTRPVVASLVATVVLLGVAIADAIHIRQHPATPPSTQPV